MAIPVVCFGLILALSSASAAPQDYRTTPVPILKQINRHNDDGSYSFGYQAADGSFKIETKYPTGEIVGKYGYVGTDGKVREVEYGASRRGFEPSGTDINVAPPTLGDDSSEEYDDGQYREDPSIYYRDDPTINYRPTASPATHRFSPTRAPAYNFEYQTQRFSLPQFRPNYQSTAPRQQNVQQAQSRIQALYNFGRSNSDYNPFVIRGHPSSNVNLLTGSYTISYNG